MAGIWELHYLATFGKKNIPKHEANTNLLTMKTNNVINLTCVSQLFALDTKKTMIQIGFN